MPLILQPAQGGVSSGTLTFRILIFGAQFPASSAIIKNIDGMCKSGLVSLAVYYFNFQDVQKKHRRGLLYFPTL